MNILREAESLVLGDRHSDYGHPLDDFTKTAKIWSAILGIEITPDQVALCMVGVKISRQVNRSKRDNLVDAAGYLATLEMVQDERARREADARGVFPLIPADRFDVPGFDPFTMPEGTPV